MSSFNKKMNLTGWLVFLISVVVYYFSIESTGSLWDCGEFILGAEKLQVVHPPGAALFLIIGRMFTLVGQMISDDPAIVAMSVNMMSGIATSFVGVFIAWITMRLTKMFYVSRDEELPEEYHVATLGAGLVAGLATVFSSSIWFSGVEGEVYALATFFSAMTFWAAIKWYTMPDNKDTDRWFVFAIYGIGLSVGVHLLSILIFPALTLLYYFKKNTKYTFGGIILYSIIGLILIVLMQSLIIVGIPKLWLALELFMVNGLGFAFNWSLIPLILIIGGVIYGGLYILHNKNFAFLNKGETRQILQYAFVSIALLVVSFSTLGLIVIRANADTPINMNNPGDPTTLLPYLNREQYGERDLLYGPQFTAKPVEMESEDRYGKVGDHYEVTSQKLSYVYKASDKVLFPRMSDGTQNRPKEYRRILGLKDKDKIGMSDNIAYLFRYQLGWMYWRYFMWNFAGRQNHDQGRNMGDATSGNWISGIPIIDQMHLPGQKNLPDLIKNDPGRNTYYMLPLIFGLIGLFYHYKRRKYDFLAVMAVFVITGIGIVIYTNQPPMEPRERDYVLVGSFMTFCIWIGMAVPAIYYFIKRYVSAQMRGLTGGAVATLLVLSAPLIMGFQNFDDHSRRGHTASRDYASDFLNSCEHNAIIFTYGDNDTYPLWYAQEVEGIRTDVRVVNLSLIAVDWYINKLRNKVNDSPPIKLTLSADAIRGNLRNQVYVYAPNGDKPMSVKSALKFVNEDHPLQAGQGQKIETYMPTKNLFLSVDKRAVAQAKMLLPTDTAMVSQIPIQLKKQYLTKDELAILDVISSNLWDRPIYFAVTVTKDKMMGLQDYVQLEGLGMRIVPIRTPSEKQLYIYGSGRVNVDKFYDNFVHKFKFGNFDKENTFVSPFYGPSIQSIQFTTMRAVMWAIRENKKDKAVEMLDTYFAGFPNMNFTYDARFFNLISMYSEAGAPEKGKALMRILADNTVQYLNYFNSLPNNEITNGLQGEYGMWQRNVATISQWAKETKDPQFIAEMASKLGK